VGLGHVAVDGTKLRANASKHKAMSSARMEKVEAELAAEVKAWLDTATDADDREDGEHGAERRGDEMPNWMADKQQRLARIRAARTALEAEARVAAAAKDAARPVPSPKADGTPSKRSGPKPKRPTGTPEPTAQRNFTDPESRIMVGRDGFIQAYNGQAAVDGKHQIIVAHRLTQSASDQDGLLPLLDATAVNAGRLPDEASADHGFCSEANLAGLVERGVRGYVATGRAKRPAEGKPGRRAPDSSYAATAQAGRSSQPLPAAEIHRRARVRADQERPQLPPASPPRRRKGHRRMGVDLHRPQSRQAHYMRTAITQIHQRRPTANPHFMRQSVTGTRS
jgi:hypothetical protein